MGYISQNWKRWSIMGCISQNPTTIRCDAAQLTILCFVDRIVWVIDLFYFVIPAGCSFNNVVQNGSRTKRTTTDSAKRLPPQQLATRFELAPCRCQSTALHVGRPSGLGLVPSHGHRLLPARPCGEPCWRGASADAISRWAKPKWVSQEVNKFCLSLGTGLFDRHLNAWKLQKLFPSYNGYLLSWNSTNGINCH